MTGLIMASAIATSLYVILGIIWIVLLITLGIMSIRRGHWVMFIIGLFFPVFWIVGALLPPKNPG